MGKFYQKNPKLIPLKDQIDDLIDSIVYAARNQSKILLIGNGGSASDCDHWAAELIKEYKKNRPEFYFDSVVTEGICAISIPSMTASMTAIANDIGYEFTFAQMVASMAFNDDILIAISTSGSSRNILNAIKACDGIGVMVVGLTSNNAPKEFTDCCNILIQAPGNSTDKIQEYHQKIYHYVSKKVEEKLWPGEPMDDKTMEE